MAAADKPTQRQLAYLRQLACERGCTFATPKTRAQASQQIEQLRRRRPQTRADRHRDVRVVREALAKAGDAARIGEDEVTGHGSTATWRHSPSNSGTSTATTASTAVGNRMEPGRYEISAGERVIYGQRINGIVRVTDAPAAGQGRRYLVERDLTSNSELRALVVDYIAQGVKYDGIPTHVLW